MSEIIVDFEHRVEAEQAADCIRRLFPKIDLAVVNLAERPGEAIERGEWALAVKNDRLAADYLHCLFNWRG